MIEMVRQPNLKVVEGASEPTEKELQKIAEEMLAGEGLNLDDVKDNEPFWTIVQDEWCARREAEAERRRLEAETKKAKALAAARAKRVELDQARQAELAAARAQAEAAKQKLAAVEAKVAKPAESELEPIRAEELMAEPETPNDAKQVFAKAGVLRSKQESPFKVVPEAKKRVEPEPPPEPTEAECQRVTEIEQSGQFPDEIFTDLDRLLALLWVLKNAYTARRCLVDFSWDPDKAYPGGVSERERRIAEIKAIRKSLELVGKAEGKIWREMDELKALMDQFSLIAFVCFKVLKGNLSRMSASGGVELRNQLEFTVRGYRCFARLGQLTYLPDDLPGVQFKYQKPEKEMPPERQERFEADIKAREEAETKAKAAAEKHAERNGHVDEMKAMLVAAGGFSEEAALHLAERAQKKYGDASDGREKLIRLAVGKLLHAEELSGREAEQERAEAEKIGETVNLTKKELDQRLADHKAEQALQAQLQSEAAEAAQRRTLRGAERPASNGGKKGKPDGTKGKKGGKGNRR